GQLWASLIAAVTTRLKLLVCPDYDSPDGVDKHCSDTSPLANRIEHHHVPSTTTTNRALNQIDHGIHKYSS
ncbi:MAG: hypothetical protein WBN43_11635, partial [Thiogranum sp.]